MISADVHAFGIQNFLCGTSGTSLHYHRLSMLYSTAKLALKSGWCLTTRSQRLFSVLPSVSRASADRGGQSPKVKGTGRCFHFW
jgi:hypothetical protein